MRKYLLKSFGILFVFSAANLNGQEVREAFIDENGIVSSQITNTQIPQQNITDEVYSQLDGFPLDFLGNPTFKNSRGVTLADINGDGVDEIFFVADNLLVAASMNGDILWEKEIIGVGTYPPTVVDLDGDGTFEIVQTTHGVPITGRVYLVNAETGEDFDGWPLNFDDNMILSAASVADLTGDGIMDITFCERVSAAVGFVHAVKMDGTPINGNWPFEIPGTPAITPSLGDVNNDGVMDVVLATSSGIYYAVNSETGEPIDGFPVTLENASISYQSPILVDLTGDGFLNIVGANHGDVSGFFVLDHEGNLLDGWPQTIGNWTYTPPTVVDLEGDGEYTLFFSDRLAAANEDEEVQVIYAFDKDGNMNEDMSISKHAGTEGVMSIADINNDGVMDIIFPSIMTEDGMGFIHAYSLDGSGELEGFPLRPEGYTFLNGATFGASADGNLVLVANSHTINFGAADDQFFLNVYDMEVPYNPANILRNGYKGDNTRSGLVETEEDEMNLVEQSKIALKVYPNPSNGKISIMSPDRMDGATVQIISMNGQLNAVQRNITLKAGENQFDFSHLSSGVYILTVQQGKFSHAQKIVIK